jgi:hypothetical protein
VQLPDLHTVVAGGYETWWPDLWAGKADGVDVRLPHLCGATAGLPHVEEGVSINVSDHDVKRLQTMLHNAREASSSMVWTTRTTTNRYYSNGS